MAKIRVKQKTITILGIETSCDETSVALLTCNTNNLTNSSRLPAAGCRLKKHFIATQIPIHARYGGVIPEVAARTHVAELVSLLDKTLGLSSHMRKQAADCRLSTADFDAIAVTQGPGLATALRVGIEAGKTLAWLYDKPLIPINHLEGHLASAWLVPQNRKQWEFPILFLLISGGHTELVLMKDIGKYKILGRTRDDASGEAFDKTAKLMGLEYPGGPKLAALAKEGNPEAYDIPRPMLHDPSLDMSFSGLKTAVRVLLQDRFTKNQKITIPAAKLPDLCASIQAAIIDVLVAKTVKAAIKVRPKGLAIVGGVSANKELQTKLKAAIKRRCPSVRMMRPAKGLHTDNGAMIAAAGLWSHLANKKRPDWKRVDAKPDLDF